MNLLFKKFTILPSADGRVTGGRLQYSLDAENGSVVWQGEISVKVWLFPVTKQLPESVIKIDPGILLSASIQVGTKITFGPLTVEITAIEDQLATASISVHAADIDEAGSAQFDLSGEYVSLNRFDTHGKAEGYDITLSVVEAQ